MRPYCAGRMCCWAARESVSGLRLRDGTSANSSKSRAWFSAIISTSASTQNWPHQKKGRTSLVKKRKVESKLSTFMMIFGLFECLKMHFGMIFMSLSGNKSWLAIPYLLANWHRRPGDFVWICFVLRGMLTGHLGNIWKDKSANTFYIET